MRSRRVLMMIATLLVGVLPPVRGTLSAGTVDIVRDRYGVPHIFTQQKGPGALIGIAYAVGYAQAQDRLFEMDIFRRAARGKLSELSAVGAPFLSMDIEARRDNSSAADLERDYSRLPALDRRILRAYSAGVNRVIAEVTADTSKLPIEFVFVPPRLWEPTDTLAVGELEFTRFGVGGGYELDNARLLVDLQQRLGDNEARKIFDDVCWIEDPTSPVTIAPSEEVFTDVDEVQRFAPEQMALINQFLPTFTRAADRVANERRARQELMARLPIPPAGSHASNAMVIAGRLSASRYPILLGGPQTGLNIPTFFWEVGIHQRDRYAHGEGLPGTPGIAMGRTDRFAFTITSSADDDTDVYAEVIDPAQPDHYLHNGRSRPFVRHTEVFAVAGQAPVTVEFLRTMHGPVIFTDPIGGLAFSRRRALDGRTTRTGSNTLKLTLSGSLREFLKRARRIDAAFNLHYADIDGNIAYFHAGRRPRRPLHTDPRLPLLGAGGQEWRGVLRQRPQVVNPAQGFIVNWNNKPAVGWPNGDQKEFWGPIHRVQGLLDGLAAALNVGAPLTPADINAVMQRAATTDVFVARIVPFLRAAVAAEPTTTSDWAALTQAMQLIDVWVNAGAPLVAVGATLPHPGATLYREFRTQAQRRIFGDELHGALRDMFYPLLNDGNQEDDHGSWDTPDALFYRALQGAAGPRPLAHDYFRNVDSGAAFTRDEALIDALRAAIAALTARFGSTDMTTWLEPKLMTSYMNLGGVNVFFGDTITERENRGSFNLLVDLAPNGASLIITPPGESGTITSADVGSEPPHLRDQLPLYQAFQYRNIARQRADVEAPATTTVLTIPAGL